MIELMGRFMLDHKFDLDRLSNVGAEAVVYSNAKL